jgi:hypothetical protein
MEDDALSGPSLADLPLSARYALGGVPRQPVDNPGAPVSGQLDPFAQSSSVADVAHARDAVAADRAIENLLADDGAAQPVKAQWKQAHPSARKWAARREREAHDSTSRTPKPLRIMFGCVLIGIAAYLAFIAMPTRRPLSDNERAELATHAGVDENAWRFAPPLYIGALSAVGVIGFVGIAVVVRGATYRPRVKIRCRRCRTRMFAEPDGFGFRCSAGHPAASATGKILLLVSFLLAGAALGALTVISSLR